MKINEIQDLIKFVARSGVSEVELETEEFKIVIKTTSEKKAGKGVQQVVEYVQAPAPVQAMPAPVAQAAPGPAPAAEKKDGAADDSKYLTIKSPMIGTFYRKPSPDKPLFVNVGDSVKEGQTVCIIEAMKLFNEIESEVSGKIVKVLVEDNSPVEYDQPLFLVDPS
jgi:acetyl-CoA carboxylase biotin carboxyl carrier protein